MEEVGHTTGDVRREGTQHACDITLQACDGVEDVAFRNSISQNRSGGDHGMRRSGTNRDRQGKRCWRWHWHWSWSSQDQRQQGQESRRKRGDHDGGGTQDTQWTTPQRANLGKEETRKAPRRKQIKITSRSNGRRSGEKKEEGQDRHSPRWYPGTSAEGNFPAALVYLARAAGPGTGTGTRTRTWFEIACLRILRALRNPAHVLHGATSLTDP